MLTSSRETLQLDINPSGASPSKVSQIPVGNSPASQVGAPTQHPDQGSGTILVRPEGIDSRRRAIEEFEKADLVSGAAVLIENNEKPLAKVLLRESLNRDSHSPESLRQLMGLLRADEWSLKEREKLAKALCESTSRAQDTIVYAKINYEKGDLNKALDLYFDAASQIANEDGSVFEIYKDIGNIFVRMNDLDGAEEYYHKAYALNPDSDLLHVNLGTLEIQRQDWGTARDRFRSALGLNAKNDKAWVGLALAHYHLGDIDLAFANLGKAVDICPANRTAVHLMAGWGEKHQRYPEAIEALQAHLAEVSFDEDLSLALIHLFCLRQEYRFALLEIERVLLWNPFREDLYELEERLRNMIDDGLCR